VSGGANTDGDRLTAFCTAIFAVLAAIGTLYAHGRSIQALALRNQALLTTAHATELYSYYQNKQLKATLYEALKDKKDALEAQRSSLSIYRDAQDLGVQATAERERSEKLLHSFETIEIATTFFEISIAFASIGLLAKIRALLWAGVTLSAVGAVLFAIGYFQGP
jgi:hypothetical protein